jgi:hypothetical protein
MPLAAAIAADDCRHITIFHCCFSASAILIRRLPPLRWFRYCLLIFADIATSLMATISHALITPRRFSSLPIFSPAMPPDARRFSPSMICRRRLFCRERATRMQHDMRRREAAARTRRAALTFSFFIIMLI